MQDVRLEALHHVTMITGDAQANVDFCVGVLGLQLVKKTVNFDAPDMYHLYYGDDHGSPGSILTWFEIRGAQPGRPGPGMVHRLELGVPSEDSLGFWQRRLKAAGYAEQLTDGELRFQDHDGLDFALVPVTSGNPPLQAAHPGIPAEHAITGLEGARAYPVAPHVDDQLLSEVFRFEPCAQAGEYLVRGRERSFRWAYDPAPAVAGAPGAGTVHHIAWCSRDEDHLAWQVRERQAGLHVTPVQDRDYFKSIYARMPSGVLFEIATASPGFAVDEDPKHLGEELRVPRMHESLRDQIEQSLSPLTTPAVRA